MQGLQWVANPLIREQIGRDHCMAAAGQPRYMMEVVALEGLLRLVAEDLQVDLAQARQVMAESQAVGTKYNNQELGYELQDELEAEADNQVGSELGSELADEQPDEQPSDGDGDWREFLETKD